MSNILTMRLYTSVGTISFAANLASAFVDDLFLLDDAVVLEDEDDAGGQT